MTLIDGDAFAGEGLLEPLKPGEKRLLSYAADFGVLVDARRQSADGRVFRVRARDGILIQETEERVTWTYRARSENLTPTTLIIEHRMQPGWKLAEGQTPVESTADTQRFRVVLPQARETVFEVRELRQGETRIMLGDVDQVLLAQLAKSGISAPTLEQALKPVLDKKAELTGLQRRVEALQNERNTIGQDQPSAREHEGPARQRRRKTVAAALHATARSAGNPARDTPGRNRPRHGRHGKGEGGAGCALSAPSRSICLRDKPSILNCCRRSVAAPQRGAPE